MEAKRVMEIFNGHYVTPWSVIAVQPPQENPGPVPGIDNPWFFTLVALEPMIPPSHRRGGDKTYPIHYISTHFDSQESAESARLEIVQWVHEYASKKGPFDGLRRENDYVSIHIAPNP